MPPLRVAQQACHQMDLASAVIPACGDGLCRSGPAWAWTTLRWAADVFDRMWPLPETKGELR
jgi:hypothetical protein